MAGLCFVCEFTRYEYKNIILFLVVQECFQFMPEQKIIFQDDPANHESKSIEI